MWKEQWSGDIQRKSTKDYLNKIKKLRWTFLLVISTS